MNMFEDRGLGCREGEEDNCMNLCTDPSMIEPMRLLSESMAKSAHEYCLNVQGPCPMNNANENRSSECNLHDLTELNSDQINVSLVCSDQHSESCNAEDNLRLLTAGTDYSLITDTSCTSGLKLNLTTLPTPQQAILVETNF